MRIFVGYGYNERDKWVEDYVFPLLNALGCEVLHGKTVYGGPLQDEVMKVLRTADAVLGFTTRRDPIAPQRYGTHDWVLRELHEAHTHQPRIPWVEIREEGVSCPAEFLDDADAQRITYGAENLAGCLVQIAQAVRRLQEIVNVTTVRLVPASAVEQIRVLLDDPTFRCTFQSLRGTVVIAPREAAVLPIKGSVFVQLRGLTQGEMVRISISAGGRIWRSDYDSVDTIDVQVRE